MSSVVINLLLEPVFISIKTLLYNIENCLKLKTIRFPSFNQFVPMVLFSYKVLGSLKVSFMFRNVDWMMVNHRLNCFCGETSHNT